MRGLMKMSDQIGRSGLDDLAPRGVCRSSASGQPIAMTAHLFIGHDLDRHLADEAGDALGVGDQIEIRCPRIPAPSPPGSTTRALTRRCPGTSRPHNEPMPAPPWASQPPTVEPG